MMRTLSRKTGDVKQWLWRPPCGSRWPAAVDAPHLGVLLGHPARLSAAWRREEGVVAVGGEAVHDVVEPGELEAALFGLEGGPREDADGEGVAARLLHQAEVLFEDGGLVEPLLRAPVAAVQDVREPRDDRRIAIRQPRGRGAGLRCHRHQPPRQREERGGAKRALQERPALHFQFRHDALRQPPGPVRGRRGKFSAVQSRPPTSPAASGSACRRPVSRPRTARASRPPAPRRCCAPASSAP